MMRITNEKEGRKKGRWVFAAAILVAAAIGTGCENRALPLKQELGTRVPSSAPDASKGYESMAPITDLYVLIGNNKSIHPPAPYVRIESTLGYVCDGDLNKGAGGKFIYLCYTTDPACGSPITGIYVYSGKNQTHYPNSGYFHVRNSDNYGPDGSRGADLNKGAGGDYIYLLATRDGSHPPLTYLPLEITTYKETDLKRFGYYNELNWLPNDLNKGAGGRYIYLGYTSFTGLNK
jgi:hypothetical protein